MLLLGSLGLVTALIVTYFLAAPGGLGPIVSLKLMALNTWGMPATFGAQDKTSRMQAIGELIQKQEYDIYLLEELWMRPDHAHIKRLLPPGYHMTEVMDLNNPHQVRLTRINLHLIYLSFQSKTNLIHIQILFSIILPDDHLRRDNRA